MAEKVPQGFKINHERYLALIPAEKNCLDLIDTGRRSVTFKAISSSLSLHLHEQLTH